MAVDVFTSELPQTIGRFKIVRSLGVGIMGQVFLGDSGDVHYAVKVVDPRRAIKLPDAEKFEKIENPYLMRYKAIETDVQYQTLFISDYLELRPVSFESNLLVGSKAVFSIFLEGAKALKEIHDTGMVHGNLKPSNFLLRRESRFKYHPMISDFGLEYVFTDEFEKAFGLDVLPYMSVKRIKQVREFPENPANRGELDPNVDVYGLVIIMAKCLTGRLPFQFFHNTRELMQEKQTAANNFQLISVTKPKQMFDVSLANEMFRKGLGFGDQAKIENLNELIDYLERIVSK